VRLCRFDRALLLCLYHLFPSLLEAIAIASQERRLAGAGLGPRVLALKIIGPRRTA
jgi:hypothetical protein